MSSVKKEPGVKAEEEVKKTFASKPGQRYPIPSPGAGDRVFYETLYNEDPESEMAFIWCMEHGVFPQKMAGKLFENYKQVKEDFKQQNLEAETRAYGSGVSGGATKKRRTAGKGKVLEGGVDIGMSVNATEGIGMVTM